MKTAEMIKRLLETDDGVGVEQLYKAYEMSFRLQSQLLSMIYDRETFSIQSCRECLAERHTSGRDVGGVVILTIQEPLPAMKRLTEAIEEHWKAMLHAAIAEAARQGPLPWFEKAMVEIEIVTPRGSSNVRVWDTSNRAIQVILNNLKGIFFRDDDMEHMAFSVVGRWDEASSTVIRVSDFETYWRETADKSRQV